MIAKLHAWDLSPEEAARIQTELRTRLVLTWDNRPVATLRGVDVRSKTESTLAATDVGTESRFMLGRCTGQRLPERIRWVHKAAGNAGRQHEVWSSLDVKVATCGAFTRT